MDEIRCILCGRKGEVAIEENGFFGRRCGGCGLVYVSPRPSAEETLKIYEHDASQTMARQHITKTREPYALAHARHTLRIIARHQTTGSLLELGPGGGLFLHEAQQRGFEVYGLEPNPVQVAFIEQQFGIRCETRPFSAETFGARRFDIIYHCNVLSHFHDPLDELAKMHNKLHDGGILVLETGNFGDVASRYYPLIRRTERFQLPEHLFFFGERALMEALSRVGFVTQAVYRYSRIPEKRAPTVLRMLGLIRFASRLRFFIKYRLGRWFPKRRRPQTLIVVAAKSHN